METGSLRLKTGLAEMLKGGVIMDVTDADQARIAELPQPLAHVTRSVGIDPQVDAGGPVTTRAPGVVGRSARMSEAPRPPARVRMSALFKLRAPRLPLPA